MFTTSQYLIKREEEIEQYATLTEVTHELLVSLQVKISQTSYKFQQNEKFLIEMILEMYNMLIYQLNFVDYFWTLRKEEFQETEFKY